MNSYNNRPNPTQNHTDRPNRTATPDPNRAVNPNPNSASNPRCQPYTPYPTPPMDRYNKSIMRTTQIRRRRQRRRLLIVCCAVLALLIGLVLFLFLRTDRSVSGNVPYDPELYEPAEPPVTTEASVPTTSAPETTAAPEEKTFTVVVDPGHGYDDPGTGEGLMGDLSEKDITLAISLKLRDLLIAKGFDVIMTRENDEKPADKAGETYLFNPAARVAFTQALEHYDLYVSVHVDAFPSDESVRGTRVYYYQDGHPQAGALSALLVDAIEFRTGTDKKPLSIGKDYDGAYRVIRDIVEVPSALIEIGFVTNESDRTNMMDASWQEKMAEGIADAVGQYADTYADKETAAS